MFLLSSIRQWSDPVFTSQPCWVLNHLRMVSSQNISIKGLLKQLGLRTGYSSHSLRRGEATFMLQIGIPSKIN